MTISLLRPWTGADVRALREARNMSVKAFAGHLAVSQRSVSNWEADTSTPYPVNRDALGASLARLSPDEQARFIQAVPAGAIAIVDDEPVLEKPVTPDRVRHPVDGRSMTVIPQSVFLSGREGRPTFLPTYWIDTYPVTNSDYGVFVAATGHQPPRHWEGDHPPAEIADHPVTWVNHADANAYAHWADKVLPTSHHWEKAARGITGATWPWGDQATHAKTNCLVVEDEARTPRGTTPVDRFKSGVSPYGVYDMTGNVREWLSTPSAVDRYELKGGSFSSLLEDATPARFNDAYWWMNDDDTGFRCVATDLKI
ncbi:SUMF1/EgtB/PvdO family nonheme iron enzyme [Nocardia nova]|uniref:SUMF1/EgtB/PvdO family nonheme iron enzyme n=1 Tax=Nocardia nova TaxID=37330 RepID=UPI0033FFC13E